MDTIQSTHSVALSYSPDDLRFGHTNASYFLERRRNRTILEGKLRLFQLQTTYAQSYLNSPNFTVLTYRDALLSLALSLTLRCAQTRDVAYTTLLPHAKRYWTRYGNQFWQAIPILEDNDEGFYGFAGSLAFWLYKHRESGQGLYADELIKKMLHYFWTDLGVSPTASARAKQAQLFQSLGLTSIPFKSYEQALNLLSRLEPNGQPQSIFNLIAKLRQSLLTQADWAFLKQRVLLGEYSDSLLGLITDIQTAADASSTVSALLAVPSSTPTSIPIETVVTRTLQAASPAGYPLVYVAFAVEGLNQACQYLSNLSDTTVTLPFSEFLSNPAFQASRDQIARFLSTSYDALGALSLFNSLLEAKGLCYRSFLAALQVIRANQTTIETTTADRLVEFIN